GRRRRRVHRGGIGGNVRAGGPGHAGRRRRRRRRRRLGGRVVVAHPLVEQQIGDKQQRKNQERTRLAHHNGKSGGATAGGGGRPEARAASWKGTTRPMPRGRGMGKVNRALCRSTTCPSMASRATRSEEHTSELQ